METGKYADFYYADKILTIVFNALEVTEKLFDDYLTEMVDFYDTHKEKFVIIFDGRNSKYLPSSLRVKQANWMKKNELRIKEKCVGNVYLINNIILQAVLNGILFVNKPPVAYCTASTLEEAQQRAAEFLQKG